MSEKDMSVALEEFELLVLVDFPPITAIQARLIKAYFGRHPGDDCPYCFDSYQYGNYHQGLELLHRQLPFLFDQGGRTMRGRYARPQHAVLGAGLEMFYTIGFCTSGLWVEDEGRSGQIFGQVYTICQDLLIKNSGEYLVPDMFNDVELSPCWTALKAVAHHMNSIPVIRRAALVSAHQKFKEVTRGLRSVILDKLPK